LSNTDPNGCTCVTLDNGSKGDNGDGQGCAEAGVKPGGGNDTVGDKPNITVNADPLMGDLRFQLFKAEFNRANANNARFAAMVYSASIVAGSGVAVGLGMTSSSILDVLSTRGLAEAAKLTLPLGAKVAQMMARTGATNPAGVLQKGRDLVSTAISQGTYVYSNWINGTGATIYRVGNDYLVVANDGKMLSYVVNANQGTGVVSTYLQLGGR
jgi:hypothetical protein